MACTMASNLTKPASIACCKDKDYLSNNALHVELDGKNLPKQEL